MHRNTTKMALKAVGLGMALLMIATPAMAGWSWVQIDRDNLAAPGIETDTFTRHPDADIFRISLFSSTAGGTFEVCFIDKHGFDLACVEMGPSGAYIPQGTKSFTVSLVKGIDADYALMQAALD